MPEIDLKTRLEAFDSLQGLKGNNMSRRQIIDEVHSEFGISIGTLYGWYNNKLPWGRTGKLIYRPELFYVLGALLGDGCLYNWQVTKHYTILVGDRKFANKYANMVTECSGTKTRAYIDRSKNIWFVRTNNFNLYSFFKKCREDIQYLKELTLEGDRKSALLFIEGFFDAEGCVKVVKEKRRKTAKICLDITNTNFEFLELVRKLLEEHLNIEARYSIQKGQIGEDGSRRKRAYHLRIYKKEFIRRFFEEISTAKLSLKKARLMKIWLNNGL